MAKHCMEEHMGPGHDQVIADSMLDSVHDYRPGNTLQ